MLLTAPAAECPCPQALLSVSGDGSICIVPLDALAQLGGDASFRAASSWSGYSQGRWVDSQTFATVSRKPCAGRECGCVHYDICSQEVCLPASCCVRADLGCQSTTSGCLPCLPHRKPRFHSAPACLLPLLLLGCRLACWVGCRCGTRGEAPSQSAARLWHGATQAARRWTSSRGPHGRCGASRSALEHCRVAGAESRQPYRGPALQQQQRVCRARAAAALHQMQRQPRLHVSADGKLLQHTAQCFECCAMWLALEAACGRVGIGFRV